MNREELDRELGQALAPARGLRYDPPPLKEFNPLPC
jgi:hypothetical protein